MSEPLIAHESTETLERTLNSLKIDYMGTESLSCLTSLSSAITHIERELKRRKDRP